MGYNPKTGVHLLNDFPWIDTRDFPNAKKKQLYYLASNYDLKRQMNKVNPKKLLNIIEEAENPRRGRGYKLNLYDT